jgi:hypothetical protein
MHDIRSMNYPAQLGYKATWIRCQSYGQTPPPWRIRSSTFATSFYIANVAIPILTQLRSRGPRLFFSSTLLTKTP